MTDPTDIELCNEVHIVGRISSPPQQRTLPSGDDIVSWRVVVTRRGGQDTLECTAWNARTRRSAASWQKGDIVEVDGAIRRRFWRTPSGTPASRYDIEVAKARRLSR